MGAFFSKVAAFLRRRRHSSLARTPTPKADPLTSPAQNSRTQPRSKPAASDLVFENLTAQTACKRPGSLGSCYGPGVPFEIYNCSDASLFVLDWTAQVTVDKCKNCFIFIGPCAGSLFLRDCTGCTVVVAAQQLRTRDCVDLRLHAFVLTQPIIESSTAVSVGCFAGHYAALDEQFAAAGLSVWNSVWWDLYDFNDKTGRNYTLMSKDEAPPISPGLPVDFELIFLSPTRTVPKTYPGHAKSVFVTFDAKKANQIIDAFPSGLVKSRQFKFANKSPREAFHHLEPTESSRMVSKAKSHESFIVLAFSMEPKILREAMVLENDCYTSGEHDGQRDLECFWGLISVAI